MRSLSFIENFSLSCTLLLVSGVAQGQNDVTLSPAAPQENQPVSISIPCSSPGAESEWQLTSRLFYRHSYSFCDGNGPEIFSFGVLPAGDYAFYAFSAPVGAGGIPGPGGSLNFTVVPSTTGGVSPGVSYNIINSNSSLCMTSFGAAPIAGNPFGNIVFQNACAANSTDQQWQFQATDSGYYTIQIVSALGFDLDVENQSVANGTFVHLWKNYDLTNQQWMPVAKGGGTYELVGRASGRCLDVPGGDRNVENLQIYDCNGSAAQSYFISEVPAPAK